MEPGQPESKRPRLANSSPWSALPNPTTPQYPVHPPYRSSEHPLPPPLSHHVEDRRPHEQESYAPPNMPDHHRPQPHSPAHPSHYPYARGDAVVKRDPNDDAILPHLRRPGSTGGAPDGLPPPPTVPPINTQHPPQHPDDQRRHMSYDGGPSIPHSPAPTMYRPAPPGPFGHPPPTPLPHHHSHSYESAAQGYGSSNGEPYTPTVAAVSTGKRKAQRASQACESCRQLKAKCDELKPCKNCSEKGIKCNYREPLPKQSDKANMDIVIAMASLKDSLILELRKMEKRMTQLERNVMKQNGQIDTKLEPLEDDMAMSVQSPSTAGKVSDDDEHMSPGEQESRMLDIETARLTVRQIEHDDEECQPGPHVEPGKPSIPINHTTPANFLLQWPSVKSMVHQLLHDRGVYHFEDFPIRQEQRRGILRIFGKGEGNDSEEFGVSINGGHADQIMTDPSDDLSDMAPSPPVFNSAPQENWMRTGGAPSPVTNVEYKGVASFTSEITPDFDLRKVREYVKSFKDNILIMHPILVPKELDALVTIFLEGLPKPDGGRKSSTNVKFAVGSNSNMNINSDPSLKRKRASPGVEDPTNTPSFQSGQYRPIRPFRSIHHALVLLVLALGKICLHKERIPEPVPEFEAPSHFSPQQRHSAIVSPTLQSPSIPNALSSGLPSPKENERTQPSRRSSLQGGVTNGPKISHFGKRNIDVIPGLEYYTLATEILGHHFGGASLKHVYCFLFAGLYHGQLGRVMESWSYMHHASVTLQNILRPSLSRLAKIVHEGGFITDPKDNLRAYAFWTCLQLESDIVAELPFPHSGILLYEDKVPFPNIKLALEAGHSERVTSSYHAQLWLRKQLNKIHDLLYNPSNPEDSRKTMEEKTIMVQASVADARDVWCPSEFTFSNHDPPADEILAARLRAKYWGSQVIIYRPFVKMILNSEQMQTDIFASSPPDRSQWPQSQIDVGGIDVPPSMDPRALNYARLGIDALIESTRAFHGLNPNHRIIVTNVFTTAHAQWGNLVTLAACYRHTELRQLINRDTLVELFNRTISFFKLIAHRPSALHIDLEILIGLANQLGFPLLENPEQRVSSSFSSIISNSQDHSIRNSKNDQFLPEILAQSMPPPQRSRSSEPTPK